ncbi:MULTISPECIES: asparaginase [Ramlibacter]|uniref:asparaginase n=1 Tax=Ramlibacter TaxID=174951 RepID=UPI00351BD97C
MTADRIVLLGTGGTIAGVAPSAADHVGYQAAQLGVDRLLEGLPGLAGLQVVAEQVAQIDSKDMEPAVWRDLAGRCAHWLAQPDVQGIVVTHGTDTLEETAYFLHRVLPAAKPVVLTCAMRPATALAPDGPQNIVDAIAVVRTPGARGVTVACAGTLHGAEHVRKVHPYRLDAFSSGDAGALGFIEEGRLRLVGEWPESAVDPGWAGRLGQVSAWPRVELVSSHAGVTGRIVDLLVDDGVQGLVAIGTGNGTLHHRLEEALLAALAKGVRVVRSTRCAEGAIVGEGATLLPASRQSPVKARIDLLLELLAG